MKPLHESLICPSPSTIYFNTHYNSSQKKFRYRWKYPYDEDRSYKKCGPFVTLFLSTYDDDLPSKVHTPH